MSDMKMSDVFNLPLDFGDWMVFSKPYNTDWTIESQTDEIECSSEEEAKHVAHAINNHDRMVEEIAELKGLVTLISLNSTFQTNMPHEADLIEKLLNKND